MLMTGCSPDEGTPTKAPATNLPEHSNASQQDAEQIEIRRTEVTLAKLQTIQQDVLQILDTLDLFVSSGINVQENSVILYVTDRPLFEATLQKAGKQLPDHVKVITVYEPLGKAIPFTVTPDPNIHFPQLKMRSVDFMTAGLGGKLIVEKSCLRVASSDGDRSHLIIWQTDYFLNNNSGNIEIWDREGKVVARVGEAIVMGGGEIEITERFLRQLREPLSEKCEGPYWLMGELVSDK